MICQFYSNNIDLYKYFIFQELRWPIIRNKQSQHHKRIKSILINILRFQNFETSEQLRLILYQYVGNHSKEKQKISLNFQINFLQLNLLKKLIIKSYIIRYNQRMILTKFYRINILITIIDKLHKLGIIDSLKYKTE
ncbi:hypothetical protein pb186bvf_002117 [Paramecium bursaria]